MKPYRVWELAKEAGVPSIFAMRILRQLGYNGSKIGNPRVGIKSASSKVFLLPLEKRALVSIIRKDYGL